jgi:hypothetical protein
MFEHYKPLRNFLRGFNLWSGLGTTYSYMQHLRFRAPLADQLKNQPLRLGKSSLDAGLHPHLVELLARELILNAEPRSGKPFNNAAVAFKAMSMIHRLDDTSWGQRESHPGDILPHLSRIAFKQFPWQSPLTNGVLARYHRLYGHSRVAAMVEAEFGMTPAELFQLLLLLAEEMLRGPVLGFEFLPSAEPSICEPVLALSDRLSQSHRDLRSMMAEQQKFDVDWAYTFNPLRAFPLVHAGNPRSVMCPAPPILIQRLTDGLYFDLIRVDKRFGHAVGSAFEDYVGAAAVAIGGGAFNLLEEQCWGKPERRSVDWIVSDKSATLFVECKLGRLDIASQTQLGAEPPFITAIERLAGHVGQVFATLAEALAGGYPHWQPDGRPVHPIVVTFHEWFAFGPFFYGHLDQLIGSEFERRGLDPGLLERYPYTICSIEEFEGLLNACREATIAVVMAAKQKPENRQSLTRGFLADRYPGSLRNAMGTFEDDMEPVINGPSRLTRS